MGIIIHSYLSIFYIRNEFYFRSSQWKRYWTINKTKLFQKNEILFMDKLRICNHFSRCLRGFGSNNRTLNFGKCRWWFSNNFSLNNSSINSISLRSWLINIWRIFCNIDRNIVNFNDGEFFFNGYKCRRIFWWFYSKFSRHFNFIINYGFSDYALEYFSSRVLSLN